MSMRAASQPNPKNSAKPNSHQSSKLKLKSTARLGLRRRGAPAGAQCAGELLDLAPLAEQARQAGEYPGRRAEREEHQQHQDHGKLPGPSEKEAQGHRLGVEQRENEYHEEQQRSQHPRQLVDESLQSKTAVPCRCRRSSTAGPRPFISDPPSRAIPCPP